MISSSRGNIWKCSRHRESNMVTNGWIWNFAPHPNVSPNLIQMGHVARMVLYWNICVLSATSRQKYPFMIYEC